MGGIGRNVQLCGDAHPIIRKFLIRGGKAPGVKEYERSVT